jgi:hypothetical protein
MYFTTVFTIAKIWNWHRCQLKNGDTKNVWYMSALEYCSAIKKSEIVTFARIWMALEDIMLKARYSDRYCMFSLICGI